MRYILVENLTKNQFYNASFYPLVNKTIDDTIIIIKVNEDWCLTGENTYKIPGEYKIGNWVIKAGGHITLALFTKEKYDMSLFLASVVYSCRSLGIEAVIDGRNDVFIIVDGKKKKFCGGGYGKCGDWNLVGGAITFKFNTELGKQILGNDITEKVAGLWDVKDFDLNVFINTMVGYIANRLNTTITNDIFSKEELINLENYKR